MRQITTTSRSAPTLDILVIEDHADSADLLVRLLRRAGHRPVVVGTCARAVDLLNGGAALIDLVIGDVGLPDGDGARLLAQVKRTRGTAVLALTGNGTAADERRYRELGLDAWLVKPVLFPALLGKVAELAGLRYRPPAEAAADGAELSCSG